MKEIFELLMMICFGISWPISVVKSLKSKSTGGKSLVFIIVILVGYISGITGKIVNGRINYVFVIYCFNLAVVTTDLVVYLINRRREKNLQGE